MSFIIDNCCLKLNYLICGTKKFSSTKKKFNSQQQTIVNGVTSNSKIINQNESSPISLHQQYNINSLDHIFQPKINFSSQLNSSNESHSTLNNQIIIKDVILHRSNQNQRFGLTLSYGITSKSTTNIYIEQVEKNSIGDYQGKLKRGDQIIKINNYQVLNREQAIQIINQSLNIILQIIRFKISEDDSGIILASNTDFETINKRNSFTQNFNSLSCLISNNSLIKSRRCLSLNDLIHFTNIKENFSKIYSQSLFDITTDNDQFILKPLPFNNHYQQNQFLSQFYYRDNKQNRRRYREQCLQELLTTDDEIMSELKQGRYWTKKQRKQQFQRLKQSKQRIKYSIHSTTEDFNLLNRIFLRENQQELKQKPYLAVKYKQQSIIEKEKLKKFIQKYPIQHHLTTKSNTILSIHSTQNHSSTIII